LKRAFNGKTKIIAGDVFLVHKLNLEDSLRRRISLILSEVEARGFEAVVFLNEVIGQNPSNFVYVSGPWGLGDEHGTLVFDVDGGSTVVMPHWGAKAMEESSHYDRVIAIKQEKGHHIKGTMEAIVGYDPKNVCFDLSTVSTQLSYKLGEALGISLTPDRDVSDHVFRLRAIKDDFEIAEIKRAITITEEAVMELIQGSLPGVNTWDLKKKLDASMIERGAYEFSFNSSIRFARGPGRPYDVIRHGDMLRVDVGCRVETGYCSDMGRTWPITMDADVRDYLDRAVAAHGEAMKNIKAGVSGNEVLERASEINLEYGFEPLVRCGHQIGLDCHDYTMPYSPSFGPIETDSQPLEKGMTLTFEPQHTDSKMDMRSHIEDIVLVTEREPVILNELPWKVTW
jgi:Xaa-Pro aminopeptidase